MPPDSEFLRLRSVIADTGVFYYGELFQERLIFHIDVNSAFLSWESVKRVAKGQEDLRLIPAAVGGDPGKRTGIILAKSIPAKKYGVTTGEPVSLALRKCPGLVLAAPDFPLYQRNSAAFIEICRKYAPVLQKVSIDECFLDMTSMRRMYPDPVTTAYEIKDRIKGRALVEGRADDASDEVIANRIATYHAKTEPLIEVYKDKGVYHEVDATGTIAEVRERILTLMDALCG